MITRPKSVHHVEIQLIWYFEPWYALSALQRPHSESAWQQVYKLASIKRNQRQHWIFQSIDFIFVFWYILMQHMDCCQTCQPCQEIKRESTWKRSKYWPHSFWPHVAQIFGHLWLKCNCRDTSILLKEPCGGDLFPDWKRIRFWWALNCLPWPWQSPRSPSTLDSSVRSLSFIGP